MISMKARPNYMPPEQFLQVLEAIPSLHIRKWKDEDIQMMFKIDYWCALRFDEGCRLTVDSFDIDIGKIYLGKTKTEEHGEAPIPAPFIPELSLWLMDKKGLLFPGLTYNTAIKWIERLGKTLDIPAWTIPQSQSGEKTKTHIFRKSIGKDMIYGTHGTKAPITFVSKTLRHKGKDPLIMTYKYLKVDLEDVKDYWINQNKDQS